MKLLEKNIRIKVFAIGLSNIFFDRTPNAQATTKSRLLELYQTKSINTLKL